MKLTYGEARERAGLTQKDAAKRLGISLSAIYRYEAYQRPCPHPIAERMAELYGLGVDLLKAS